jgi:dTMP kinase
VFGESQARLFSFAGWKMLIAFEGIDGSGKGTLVQLVAELLRSEGMKVATLSFPQYDKTMAGRLIGLYLNGALGENLDPRLAAMLYAMDRRESLHSLRGLQKVNDIVLLDRWVGSNIAHQFARLQLMDRDAYQWTKHVRHIEHDILQIPEADMTVLLSVSIDAAVANIAKKPKRVYTEKQADAHEGSRIHLTEAADMYKWMASKDHWHVVNTMQGDVQRDPGEIAAQICAGIHRKRSVQNGRVIVDLQAVAISMFGKYEWDNVDEDKRKWLLQQAEQSVCSVLDQLAGSSVKS